MANQQYLYLTTIGHKTGHLHDIEIWYVQQGDCYYLVAEHRENAHWVQNIRANPKITVRLGDKHFNGMGAIPTDEDLITAVKTKMDDKYNWSDGLVVQLCPDN
jgi:deazaflavin-dependent oxidoreductase (nitroreductase family)